MKKIIRLVTATSLFGLTSVLLLNKDLTKVSAVDATVKSQVQTLMAEATQTYSGTYYTNIDATGGKALRDQLHTLVTPNTTKGYSGLWDIYKTADVRPDNTIWDIYGDFAFTPVTDQAGNYSGEGDKYNREHLIPQSWFDEQAPMKSDAHHVLPTDGFVNNKRSNFPFGEVGQNPEYTYTFNNYLSGTNKLGYSSFSGYSGRVFEPADCYKGDIARIYFYFVTCYYNKTISLDEGATVFDSTKNNTDKYFGLTPYARNLFLKWNAEDPVSQKEVNRNNEIFKQQGNRNPFVDNPSYVEAIWNNGEVTPITPVTTVPEFFIYEGDGINGHENLEKKAGSSVTIDGTKAVSLIPYVDGERMSQVTDSTITHTTPDKNIVNVTENYFKNGVRLTGKANGTTSIKFTKSYVDEGVTKYIDRQITINVINVGTQEGGGEGGNTEGGGGEIVPQPGEAYKSLEFTSTNAVKSTSGYTERTTGTYTSYGFSLNTAGFNNNGKQWDYIKCGSKNNDTVSTITTANPIDKKIDKVTVKFGNVANVSFAKVRVSSTSDFASSKEYSFTPGSNQVCTISISEPQENGYYQIQIGTTKSSNGCVQADKVEFYAKEEQETTETRKGGCGGSIFASSLLITLFSGVGASLLIKSKKKDF